MIPYDEIAYLIRASAGLAPLITDYATKPNRNWRGTRSSTTNSHYLYMIEYSLRAYSHPHTRYIQDALTDLWNRIQKESAWESFKSTCFSRHFSFSYGREYEFTQWAHFVIEIETFIRKNSVFPKAIQLRNRASAVLTAILHEGADWCIKDSHGDVKLYTTSAEGTAGFSVRAVEIETVTGTSKSSSTTVCATFNLSTSPELQLGASHSWTTSSNTSVKSYKGDWFTISDTAQLGITIDPLLTLQTMLIRPSHISPWMAPILESTENNGAYKTVSSYGRNITVSVMPTLLDVYAASTRIAFSAGNARQLGVMTVPYGKDLRMEGARLDMESLETATSTPTTAEEQKKMLLDMQEPIMSRRCG